LITPFKVKIYYIYQLYVATIRYFYFIKILRISCIGLQQ